MSQTYQIPETGALSSAESSTASTGNPGKTALASRLTAGALPADLKMHRGVWTPLVFSSKSAEMEAVLQRAGVFDLGYRTRLRATGKDRVRWLNGMITQAVKGVAPGQTGYTLILNPQGRIQGDGDIDCYEDSLLLETDRFQAERLLTHLRRFIIMDDVKLEILDAGETAIGIAGPRTASLLESLGATLPEPDSFHRTPLGGIDVTLVRAWSSVVTRVKIRVAAERVLDLWTTLEAAGALPCGVGTMEDLRVLEGRPQFDVDFSDKHLPQEVNLQRALNFTKGCYIGQEIVERIRARATVHRSLRQFELRGAMPELIPGTKLELLAGEAAVGELTSVARIELASVTKNLALGIARTEALEKSGTEPIRYAGGTAVPLAAPPVSLS